jgi:flagellar hook-associated protein 1 FlgK
MRYTQVAMDVASGNLANVDTPGYTRRRANAAEVGGVTQPAMWSRSSGVGTGVGVSSIERMSDALLDVRARLEHGNQSYLDTRSAVMDRVETGIGEPGANGVAAAMADFRAGWQDLANNPNGDAARSQLLARANTLASAINGQARNITTEASDQHATLDAMVAEVNTVASDLAATNKNIAVATATGGDAGTLLDQRDQLAMRLSELTGATGTIDATTGAMNMTVSDGASGTIDLVNGTLANKLTAASSDTTDPMSPVTVQVVDSAGATQGTLPAGSLGEIGAVKNLINVTLPDYMNKLNAVAASLAVQVNGGQASGFDAAGAKGGAFFGYDSANAALSLNVAITSVSEIAASAIGPDASGNPAVDGGNAAALGKQPYAAESTYQTLVNGFGTDVNSAHRLAANQTVLTGQIDSARDQLSGVSIDEEMANLMNLQHSYEAAARVMTTVDSMMDTLINRTGLTH